jgi:hypothetical protein
MDGMDFVDRMDRAFQRERAARRVVPAMEREWVWRHTFKCVCCSVRWPNEERQDRTSEVCVRCVEAAGVWN